MLGQSREDDYDRMVGNVGASRTDALYVAVDDPDELFARLKSSGVGIEMELRDGSPATGTFELDSLGL